MFAALDRELALDVIAAAGELLDLRLVVGTTGNVSVRSGGRLWITPTRTDYRGLRAGDLASADVESGRRLGGAVPSNKELPLHLAVYRARPDVSAVVHTHSPHATAWSFLDRVLDPGIEDLPYYGLEPIRTCPPLPAGSAALAAAAVTALGGNHAALLGAHGALAVGDTPAHAVARAAIVEHAAHVAWLLRGAGTTKAARPGGLGEPSSAATPENLSADREAGAPPLT